MIIARYKTKKELKEHIGGLLNYKETSLFGNEYNRDGILYVCGPSRRWFAQVTMKNGLIVAVK